MIPNTELMGFILYYLPTYIVIGSISSSTYFIFDFDSGCFMLFMWQVLVSHHPVLSIPIKLHRDSGEYNT